MGMRNMTVRLLLHGLCLGAINISLVAALQASELKDKTGDQFFNSTGAYARSMADKSMKGGAVLTKSKEAYIHGAADMLSTSGLACFPEGIRAGTLLGKLYKAMRDEPGLREKMRSEIVHSVLAREYPCSR